jgi:hypothetical protein
MTVGESVSNAIEAPPEALRGAAARLTRLFGEMHAQDATVRTVWDFPTVPRGRYRVLTISGTRGAGKTTLLEAFASSLSTRPDTIVLPPLQPEMFGPVDSVFSVVLARLRALIGRDAPSGALADTQIEVPTLNTKYNLAQALDSLLRSAALVQDRTATADTIGSSLNQYSSDFVTQVLAGEEFTVLWDATIKACAETLGRNGDRPPAIVIPIDDPDLAPELLAKILRDIRVIAKTPYVVVCVCLDLSEARTVLSADYVKSLGINLTPDAAYSIVEAQLSKALPAQLRVNLGELSLAERLAFTPLELERPSLGELLSQLEVEVPHAEFRVGDLFWLPDDRGGQGRPSPYADCLPAIPRDLEHLHHAVYALRSGEAGDDGMPDSAAIGSLLVESAIRSGFRRAPIPGLEVERLVRVERAATEDELPRLKIDFSGLDYLRESPPEGLTVRPDASRPEFVIEFRSLGILKAFVSDSGDDEQDKHLLHPSLSLALLLAREFTNYGELFQEDVSGGEPISGGGRNHVLNLREGSTGADRYFLVLPRWRTFYDYFAFDARWRSALAHARDRTDHMEIDPPALTPGLTILFMRVVAEIQMTRAPKLDPREFDEMCDPGNPEAVLIAAWERAAAAITEASLPSESARDRAFQQWITNFLPMVCHPWLMPNWLIESVLAHRAELAERMRITNFELRGTLHQRIRANLGDNWVTPIFDAFKDMPDLQLDALRTKQEQAVRLKEQEMLIRAPTAGLTRVPPPELARHAIALLRDMIREAQEDQSVE